MVMLLHTSQKQNPSEIWESGTLPDDVERPSQDGLSEVFGCSNSEDIWNLSGIHGLHLYSVKLQTEEIL